MGVEFNVNSRFTRLAEGAAQLAVGHPDEDGALGSTARHSPPRGCYQEGFLIDGVQLVLKCCVLTPGFDISSKYIRLQFRNNLPGLYIRV